VELAAKKVKGVELAAKKVKRVELEAKPNEELVKINVPNIKINNTFNYKSMNEYIIHLVKKQI
jgi:hypothetical protein